MSRVCTYLNFMGQAEEAFAFYGAVFGTQAAGEVSRMGDLVSGPGAPSLPEAERGLVAHIELPILAGHVLMGSDLVPSMGHELRIGNNVTVEVEPDSREEADRLYGALSEGGSESTGMQEMPWGYWGCTLDRYGIRWMLNCLTPRP